MERVIHRDIPSVVEIRKADAQALKELREGKTISLEDLLKV
ncbi:hypothetical protein [Candidatus Hakubella thermalkaliphila]|nr:hypothetical protein [Candidatus Hakubella thermalkaliphila]